MIFIKHIMVHFKYIQIPANKYQNYNTPKCLQTIRKMFCETNNNDNIFKPHQTKKCSRCSRSPLLNGNIIVKTNFRLKYMYCGFDCTRISIMKQLEIMMAIKYFQP